MNVLSHLRGAQVDAAIQRWQSDVFIEEFTGRPQGARMPVAVELKASIEQFDRQQQAAASGNFIPCADVKEAGSAYFAASLFERKVTGEEANQLIRRLEQFAVASAGTNTLRAANGEWRKERTPVAKPEM
jgi:hypothetical protein